MSFTVLHKQTGEFYLLIHSKWGIFGREILGVHGSLHHRGHCLPGILGKQTLIQQTLEDLSSYLSVHLIHSKSVCSHIRNENVY